MNEFYFKYNLLFNQDFELTINNLVSHFYFNSIENYNIRLSEFI